MENHWKIEEVAKIYRQPLLDLVYEAASVHRKYHNSREVQISTLLSVKTGACSEDCSYCSQSSKYRTGLAPERIYDVEKVLDVARKAKGMGSSRFCMGAAQREVKNNREFELILEMVKGVRSLGLEVCCTLGMLTLEQARRLKEAGLDYYNHNIDTSKEHYDSVITTHSFEERLQTLENIRKAGAKVCSGGIIGMGESEEDKIKMIHTLATLPQYPESVPVNALVPIPGTPFEKLQKVSVWDMVRVIATTRITMPKTMVRLSAGRLEMSTVEQAWCFMAGANSIFSGDKLLTTANPSIEEDMNMFHLLGLVPAQADTSESEVPGNTVSCN